MIEGEQVYPRKNPQTGEDYRQEDKRWRVDFTRDKGYGKSIRTHYYRTRFFAKLDILQFCSGSDPLYTRAVLIDQRAKKPTNGPFRVTEIE